MSESMSEMSEDAAETSTGLELDVVFDALSELSGEDGSGWVRVHRVQALTSLRLTRLEELLEDWVRLPSMMWVAGGCGGRASAPNSTSAVNLKSTVTSRVHYGSRHHWRQP